MVVEILNICTVSDTKSFKKQKQNAPPPKKIFNQNYIIQYGQVALFHIPNLDKKYAKTNL